MNAIAPKNRDFFSAIAARTIETVRKNSKNRVGYRKPPSGFKQNPADQQNK